MNSLEVVNNTSSNLAIPTGLDRVYLQPGARTHVKSINREWLSTAVAKGLITVVGSDREPMMSADEARKSLRRAIERGRTVARAKEEQLQQELDDML